MKLKKTFGQQTIGSRGSPPATPQTVNIYTIVAGSELTPVPIEGVKKMGAKTLPTEADNNSTWIPLINKQAPANLDETNCKGVGVAQRVDDGTLILIWNGQESAVTTDLTMNETIGAFRGLQSPYIDNTVSPAVSGNQLFYLPTYRI